MNDVTDHPTQAALLGVCSRCHDKFDWRLLEPLVTIHDRISMLCPGCRMERKPVCCEGDADAK